MTRILHLIVMATMLCLTTSQAHAQGAGIEWETLNQEVNELYRAGQYGRAMTVAKAALKVAEQNVGLEHPKVAQSLENLAKLYRSTKRPEEARKLEARAKNIRAIKR